MITSLECIIFIGRRSTSGHRTVGEEEEDHNNEIYEKQKHVRRFGEISLVFETR